MGDCKIPSLQYASTENIHNSINKSRQAFLQHKTRDVEFRLLQLRRLYWSLKDHEQLINEALFLDLRKPLFEAQAAELIWLQNDIIYVTRNLHKWVRDEKAEDIDMIWKLTAPKIRKDPLGCVLVIGACNYPFQLTFGPVIGAIAAGNTVVIKPSEIAPRSAAVIQQIVETSLDPSCYTVIQGGIAETKELLAQHWDKIFFTGSAKVGRIVATAAASHLTPTVLELGGVNPAIISKHANPRLVARRMLWGKILNAGQTCTSQNYLLVERPILPAVVEEFKRAYKEFYPHGAKASSDYARIINKAAFDRLRALLDECSGTILMGGDMDKGDLFVEPTLIQIHSPDDPILSNETFGPIIPLLPVEHLDEAVEIANGIQNTPLGLYPFGKQGRNRKRHFEDPLWTCI